MRAKPDVDLLAMLQNDVLPQFAPFHHPSADRAPAQREPTTALAIMKVKRAMISCDPLALQDLQTGIGRDSRVSWKFYESDIGPSGLDSLSGAPVPSSDPRDDHDAVHFIKSEADDGMNDVETEGYERSEDLADDVSAITLVQNDR